MNKDLRKLIKVARSQGWTVTKTNNGHYRWESPSGGLVFTPSTPSEYRSSKNSLSHLKKCGLTL